MYHYMGNPMKDKIALADCIEAVLGRGSVPNSAGASPAPVVYEFDPSENLSMVAESPAPYGTK